MTVEFAVGLPSLVLVLTAGLACAAWTMGVVQAQHAAAEGARAALVSDDQEALAAASRAGPSTAGATINRESGLVTVCVWSRSVGVLAAREACAVSRDRP